jgi:tRNA (cmo5U34)-methyltransferase
MQDQKVFDFDQNKAVTADDYDVTVRRFVPGYDAIFSMALALLEQRLLEAANLLIVGAGSGMELSLFGSSSRHWQMTGVDPSDKMLGIASRKIEALGLRERVTLIKDYVNDLPLTPAFDAATSILVMHFLPDDGSKLSFLQSIQKRLREGAALLLVDYCGKRHSESFERIASAWKAYGIRAGISAEKMEEIATRTTKQLPYVSEKRVIELLQQAGFSQTMQFYKAFMFTGWIAVKD